LRDLRALGVRMTEDAFDWEKLSTVNVIGGKMVNCESKYEFRDLNEAPPVHFF
jgi:hypothetical protein